ncbi:LysR family transcriptional regulator [Neiella marina]|uniref:LysR family transcriptional regulator n=1 Tax=Neiella marina TaxID=508461 RepID=A0A8J2UAB4_9GAMM|nr:LysR family transcriptional regulator [Neiella marina]GGA89592.1 LysR family transcriptional regulator [Neiella marina]
MDMTSRLLLFLEVTERGSFARAAEFRGIDRSVVSKQLGKLESELGVRLLNRSTRSFSLTAAGVEMVRKAEELRALLGDTVRVAENFHSEPKGLLKITSTASLAQQVIQPVINEFQQQYPQVEVELTLDDRLLDIVSEGFDLAFRVGEPRDSSLIARYLARNRLIMLASPEFIERYGNPTTIEQLAELPGAGYSGDGFRADVIKYADDFNLPNQVQMRCNYYSNDIEMLRLKALSGTAYYMAPAFQIRSDVLQGRLVPIMTDLKLLDFAGVYAVYPHRDLPVRTRLFFEAIKTYIGEEAPIWEHNIPGFDDMYGNKSRAEWQHLKW